MIQDRLQSFYYNSSSILVINPTGRIKRVYTPFRVTCTELINDLYPGSVLYVDEVFPDDRKQLLYKINGAVYPSKHFSISIKF